MIDLVQCRENSPVRPVAWRWERARIQRQERLPRDWRGADRWVVQASLFQDAWERAETGPGSNLYRLEEQMPAVFAAHELRLRANHPLTWELEARLLTEESYTAVAAHSGLTAEVVETYESLFFNVKDRLQSVVYIHSCAISPTIYCGLSSRHVDFLWKLLAYHGGPHVLDAIIAPFQIERLGGSGQSPNTEAYLAEVARSTLAQKALVASWTLPVNEKTALPLIRLDRQVREREVKSTRGGRGSTLPEEPISRLRVLFGDLGQLLKPDDRQAEATDPSLVACGEGNANSVPAELDQGLDREFATVRFPSRESA